MRPGVAAGMAASLIAAFCLAAGPAAAAGALAVGLCDRHGYSSDAASIAAASDLALKSCTELGDRTCQVVVTTQQTCLALAGDGNDNCGARGWAFAPTDERAKVLALLECRNHGGSDCVIKVAVCDTSG